MFKCLNCQKEITDNNLMGTANRNHCPFCLWSKHLDLKIPGDRKSNCLGLMKPISLAFKKDGEIMIVHKCQKCELLSKNRISGDDDVQAILKIEDSVEIRTALFGKHSAKGGWTFGPKMFKKTPEDFICQVCGEKVNGTGFTDHCPCCLYSLHVDINPGDRKSGCLGLMEPVATKMQKGEWRIFYKCQKCGFTHFNKISPSDNMEIVIELSIWKIKEN